MIKDFIRAAVLVTVLSIGVAYVSAWTGPTATFPGDNIAAPVNVGGSLTSDVGDQTKTGGFWSQKYLGTDGGGYFGGNIQTGNFYFDGNDDAWLRLRDGDNGNYKAFAVERLFASTSIQIRGGSPDSGKVLTATGPSGVSTWKNLTIKSTTAVATKTGTSPLKWGTNTAPAICPAGYIRSGCNANCNGITKDWDYTYINTYNGEAVQACGLDYNSECQGPTIRVYALCLKIEQI